MSDTLLICLLQRKEENDRDDTMRYGCPGRRPKGEQRKGEEVSIGWKGSSPAGAQGLGPSRLTFRIKDPITTCRADGVLAFLLLTACD